MDKAKRRILLPLLSFCLLLNFLVFPVGAADEASVYEVTDSTAVEKDLANMMFAGKKFSVSDYPVNTIDDYLHILRFLEVGYNENRGFGTGDGLYIYLYNPSGKAYNVNSTQNRIQLKIGSKSFAAYEKYDLIFCDTTDNYLYMKFRVDIDPAELNECFGGTDMREYDVSDIELHYANGLNATSYTVGGSYLYTGSETSLYCFAEDLFVIRLELHPTYYRSDVISSEGYNSRNELSSVYFSLPNSVVEAYGSLYSIRGEYYENRIVSVLTENEEYAELMQPLEGTAVQNLDGYDSDQYASEKFPALTGALLNEEFGIYYQAFYDSGLNVLYRPTWNSYIHVNNRLSVVPYVFYISEIVDEKCAVSSDDLKERVKERGLITVSGSENTTKTVYDISIEDGYTLKSLKSSAGGFIAFLAELGSWFRQDASTDVVIESAIGSVDSEDCLIGTEQFSEKYYVAPSDVDDIKLAVTAAELKNETVYLLRFAQSVAMTYDAEIDKQSSGITVDNANQTTLLYEQTYYKDFDILTLSFRDEHGSLVVVPVASSPTDVVGEIEPTIDETFGDGAGNLLKLVGLFLGLIILIVVLLLFGDYIVPLISNFGRSLRRRWRKTKAAFKPKKKSNSKNRKKK